MKLQELFSDESKWTKKAFARNNSGKPEWPQDTNATCWCLMGGMLVCYTLDEIYNIKEKIYAEINFRSISKWQDADERTFADIKQLIEKLDI